jgi:tRNA(fMet)-specific endonuclease VapC
MNARYLLDTSAASYAITKKSLAFDHHLAKVPMAALGVSTVTEAELRYGLARRPSPALQATIDTFLLAVTVFPWDSEAAHHYGDLRAGLERLGQLLGSMDMMIAAHALSSWDDSHIKRCGVQTDQASEGRTGQVMVG